MAPTAMAMMKGYTESCSDDVQRVFDSFRDITQKGIDSMCVVMPPCNTTMAEKCLADFSTAKDKCGAYDVALACLTKSERGCNMVTIQDWKQKLDNLYAPVAPTCEPLPEFELPAAKKFFVSEGETAQINITMTEAMTDCNDCYMAVRLELSHGDSVPRCSNKQAIPQLAVVSSPGDQVPCSMVFRNTDVGKPHLMTMVATIDGRQDKGQTLTAKITAVKIKQDMAVKQRQLAQYEITVGDKDKAASCANTYSKGLVSVSTFDGEAFKNFGRGIFLLYKHETMPFEVRTLNIGTTTGKTMTCGVIVQSGSAIFFAENCPRRNQKSQTYTEYLFITGNLTKGTEFYRKGKKISVVMPTGTMVTVEQRRRSGMDLLNTYISASAMDVAHTKGLCGFYDDKITNDLPGDTGHSREQKISNLIQESKMTVEQQNQMFQDMTSPPESKFCTCTEGDQVTSQCMTGPVGAINCDLAKGKDVTQDLVSKAIYITNSNRRKRQTGPDLLDLSDVEGDLSNDAPQPTWSGDRNITEQEATAYCQKEINDNTLVQNCETVLNNPDLSEPLIQTCVDNVQVSDTLDGSVDLSSLEGTCPDQLNRVDTTDAGTTVDSILSQTCPEDCNNNGICQDNGECACLQNWLGPACAVNENVPPEVSDLNNDGLCDLASAGNDCSQVTVNGNNFVTDKTPKCHFQKLMIDENGATPTGAITAVDATVLTSSQVSCVVPAAMRTSLMKWAVQISVSNDGILNSTWTSLVAYSSNCYTCTTTSCQVTGCVIDGNCYKDHEDKSGDVCHYCDSSVSKTSWTMKIAPPTCELPTQPPMTTQSTEAKPTTEERTQSPTTKTTPGTTQERTQEPTTPRPTTQKSTTTVQPSVTDKTTGTLGEQEKIIIIVVAVVAGLFAVLSCILAVKLIQRKPETYKPGSPRGSSSGSGPGSYDGHPREFDNLAYDNFEKRPGGGITPFESPKAAAYEPTQGAYPQNIVDMSAVEDEPATKL